MRIGEYLDFETSMVIFYDIRLSRGRGIICLNNLTEILDHVKVKDSLWVV